MSIFAGIWAAAAPNLFAVYGEPIEIRHVLASEFTGGGILNPDIPPFTVTGVLDVEDKVLHGFGERDGAKSEIVVSQPTVDFQVSVFGDLRPRPVSGTIIVAVSRAGQPQFVVRDVRADEAAILTCMIASL